MGCHLRGRKELDTTEATQQQQLYKEDLESFARKTCANIVKVEILKENKYDKKEVRTMPFTTREIFLL